VGKDAHGAFLLKGDACPAPDGWIGAFDVLGVVVTADGAPVPLRTSSAQRAQITHLVVKAFVKAARKMWR
jgi:hypothetical protein